MSYNCYRRILIFVTVSLNHTWSFPAETSHPICSYSVAHTSTSTSTKVYKTYLWSPYHLTPTTAPPPMCCYSEYPEQPQLTMGKGRLISWARCILGSLVPLLSACIPLLWGRGRCEFWIWGKCLTIDQGSLVRSRDKLSCCLLTKCWQWVSGSGCGKRRKI